jgi:GH25 family lysozyme M1 (1,4-beta-N-acetylmuramidase)
LQILSLIEKEHGKQPIIYSRANWIEQYTLPGTWRNDYDWWLAQYLSSGVEHQGPPTLPKGVTRDKVVIHQTSDRGDGALYGAQSKAIDLNRWQKTEADFLAFIGQTTEPEPADAEKLAILWNWYKEAK